MVATTVDQTRPRALHPVHAFLLASIVPLFLGALLSDIAYESTYQVQWTNFASWLIFGGLVFGGALLLFVLADLRHHDRRRGRYLLYALLVLAIWILGFFNALMHAKDAWAAMPEGLVLSVIVAVLACVATWIGFSTLRIGDTR